ncbi:MAG: recombination mediator RecR [Bacilli bacterium]|mgnify:CR=1 FL=1|nr:recombination mediator RecR [Bacilli bacterium]
MLPNSLKRIIDCFKKLPGIGEKTAERLAFALLDSSKEQMTIFSDSIIDIRDNICYCSVCGNISDSEICSICSSSVRDDSIVLVVEKSKDILSFEKIGVFKGKYHVLNGLISPIDNIGPNDINLNSLISRVKNGNIKEIIFALKPSIEGETTLQYIKKLLYEVSNDVKVSKLAIGVPIGADMEYIDSLTLELAIDERKSLN